MSEPRIDPSRRSTTAQGSDRKDMSAIGNWRFSATCWQLLEMQSAASILLFRIEIEFEI
jgi:hypothetical protein